ncbi:MAG: hypothetical protein NZ552_05575 [Planctomycetes bacterium]|nr:hypothetical protein [Planctomycetota bacterium]
MSTDYTLVLRACPESHRESAAAFIGKLFSLKEHTAQQIVASCPIVLLGGLGREEAAAMLLLTRALAVLGARVEVSPTALPELPKIDWPRRPQVFRRELTEWVTDWQWSIPVPGGGQAKLIDLLVSALEGKPVGRAAFTAAAMPEITPFGVAALPAATAPPPAASPGTGRILRTAPAAPPTSEPGTTSRQVRPAQDAMARLNELFPDDASAPAAPAPEDITAILNRILPEEGQPIGAGSGSHAPVAAQQGYSLFIAKVIDEERRQKAAALIAEIAKITPAEADALTRKMIIQVLRGVSREEAEAAKAQFAKIGILARIKGPE